MNPADAFAWRAPKAPDWDARIDALLSSIKAGEVQVRAAAIAQEARTLSGHRIDDLGFVKVGRVAKRLWAEREHVPQLRATRLVVLGNRTLTYLARALPAAALGRGLLLDVVEGEFDTVVAVAQGRLELDTGGRIDACLLVLDEAAFGGQDDPGSTLERWIDGLRKRLNAPVIVATIAQRPDLRIASADRALARSHARIVADLNDAIHAGAERGDWLVVDLAALASEIGANAWFDLTRHHEAKVPFALGWCPIAADHVARVLAAMAGKSGRVLVLDLDNTVWGGVIGDDGLAGIRVGQGSGEGEAYLAMQRLALELRSRGVALAVCSKNDEWIAREPFEAHPDMLLKLDHIAVFQANWADKATNLRAIAQELNLGLDALVFVDDNPAERERVRQELPAVIVPELGDDPALFPRLIVASGAFEHLQLTAEDRSRADAYQTVRSRSVQRASAENYDAYLRSLEMRMQIAPFDAIGRARIAQLINKSNQFNLTTRRYSELEVAALETSNALTWQVRLSDAFGDHGMIAVVIVKRDDAERWDIDTWLMSCRVLERGVEQTLMNELVVEARAKGVASIGGTYIATERNGLVAEFFERMQFALVGTDAPLGAKHYVLKVARYEPFTTAVEVASR